MKHTKRDDIIQLDELESGLISGGFIPLALAAVPHIITYYGSAKVAYGAGAAVGAGAYAYANS